MSCPHCFTKLENYSHAEGGYCPVCEEWFPDDVIQEALEEEFQEDEEDEIDYE